MIEIKRTWRCLESPQKPKYKTRQRAVEMAAASRTRRLAQGLAVTVTEPYICPSCGWYHNRTVRR